MNHGLRLLGLVVLVGALVLLSAAVGRAEHDGTPSNYPQSLEQALATLLTQRKTDADDVGLLVKLSEVYMDMGDDLYTENERRRRAYEEGTRLARRAIELQETNAHAHFLYAANLGNEKRLKGAGSAMLGLNDVKSHVSRAIALDPSHARALQFMGGLLAELPWLVGGDRKAAQDYLERAVASDGNYTNARILLAKLYIKQDRIDDARAQLEAVTLAKAPHCPYAWTHTFKPEAERLLKQLSGARS